MKTTIAALALVLMAAGTGSAQSVTSAELQRLQDEIYQAGTEVSRLRTSNGAEAGRLQDELDDLREEAIYLKVKLRKEGTVERREYTAVRNQLQDLRSRARGDAPSAAARTSPGSNTTTSGSSVPNGLR